MEINAIIIVVTSIHSSLAFQNRAAGQEVSVRVYVCVCVFVCVYVCPTPLPYPLYPTPYPENCPPLMPHRVTCPLQSPFNCINIIDR